MRLQKFMADAGIASRRKCEEYIAEGRVKVNGNTAVIGCTVEDGDEVLFDGNPVCGKTARVAIVLNKPQGVVCTSSDPEGRRTVVDYVKELPGFITWADWITIRKGSSYLQTMATLHIR